MSLSQRSLLAIGRSAVSCAAKIQGKVRSASAGAQDGSWFVLVAVGKERVAEVRAGLATTVPDAGAAMLTTALARIAELEAQLADVSLDVDAEASW